MRRDLGRILRDWPSAKTGGTSTSSVISRRDVHHGTFRRFLVNNTPMGASLGGQAVALLAGHQRGAAGVFRPVKTADEYEEGLTPMEHVEPMPVRSSPRPRLLRAKLEIAAGNPLAGQLPARILGDVQAWMAQRQAQ